FWATVKAKTVNGEVQLQALVDGKKIIITQSTVRRDIQLEDAEGVDCLPNATIFEHLALVGYEQVLQKLTFYKAFFSPRWKFLIHIVLQCLSPKTTAWNEFNSTMTSAIICLAINQKFNFSKFIFECMVKNLDNVGKFFMYPSLVRAATTASSLEAEQDSGNIIKTRSKATPNEAGSQGTTSDGGPKRQETMEDTIAQTRFENVSKLSNDPLLARGNTLKSGEDSLKLNELMELCTNLQQRVLDLETTKTTQANEIASLNRRVKKLEKKDRSRTHKLKRLYKVGLSVRVESSEDEEDLGEDASKQGRRIHDIDADEDITLVNDDNEISDVDTLAGEEVFVAEQSGNVVEEVVDVIDAAGTIPVSAATITDVEITLAQALAELKSAKPKADKDKGKGIMIKEHMVEQVKPVKRLEQMRLEEELAFKLQVGEEEEEEEERLAREKAQQIEEANIAWDDV
ncbi:hypothetical protein Tco_1208242, partial [Tanacetum coccineum]